MHTFYKGNARFRLTMNGSKFIRFAGFVGIIVPMLGLSAVFISTFLCGAGCGEAQMNGKWGTEGSFSWSRNALSDLGVSQVADLFNYPLILVGILNFIFTIGFVRAYSKDTLFYIGGILLMLGGGSLSLVGVFTEDYGALHSYVSLGYFVLFPIAIALVGFTFLRMNEQIKGYLSIGAGISALLIILSALALQWHTLLDLGFAVPEIIEAIVIAAWIVWMSVSLVHIQ